LTKSCSYGLHFISGQSQNILEREKGLLELSVHAPSATHLDQFPYVFVDDCGIWLWHHSWGPLQGHHRLVGRRRRGRLLKEHTHLSTLAGPWVTRTKDREVISALITTVKNLVRAALKASFANGIQSVNKNVFR
jgi:hypothetical protein